MQASGPDVLSLRLSHPRGVESALDMSWRASVSVTDERMHREEKPRS